MTEILTESFCERCGTRYTFESARPRARLKGVKVLSRGLKNFVMSDDTSIEEAMAAARSEAEREVTSHQLDAFHKTFNFCLSCRQYTCPNCWNGAEARCLSCAPLALTDAAIESDGFRVLRDATVAEPVHDHGTVDREPGAWPDLGDAAGQDWRVAPTEALAPADTDTNPSGAWSAPSDAWAATPPPGVEPEPIAAAWDQPIPEVEAEDSQGTEVEPEPIAAAWDQPIAAADASAESVEAGVDAAVDDPLGKAAAQTAGLLQRFRPGQSLDAELDAYERERREAVLDDDVQTLLRDAEPEAVSAAQVEPAPRPFLVAEPLEPAPAAASEQPVEAIEVEPVAPFEVERAEPVEPAVPAAAEILEPAPEVEPEPLAATPAADVVEQPTWRIETPAAAGPGPADPPQPDRGLPLQGSPAPVEPVAQPIWPPAPQWPRVSSAPALPFLGRQAAAEGGIEALWAASNQELVTAPPAPGRTNTGIRPCVSCGLSLSATARFCRRCGTLQGG